MNTEINDSKVKINLDYIRPNSKIIFPLYSSNDVKILDERTALTLNKLKEIKLKYGNIVYGLDSIDNGIISEKHINQAINTSKEIIKEIASTDKLTKEAYNSAENVIENIIQDLNSSEIEAIKLLKNLRYFDEYIYQHSLNVGILSAVLAKLTGSFSPEQIKNLAIGAYLLDIGLIKIDREILKKKTIYTYHDMQKMKQHPQFGYEILKNIKGIDPVVLQTLLFHHEKNNYKGYYQLPYELMPLPPKIVSVCDIYDALTTPRPYRNSYSPTNALKFLVNSINIHFDYSLISNFVNHLGPLLNNTQSFYALHDFCELNTKELAMITNFNMHDYMKPVVMVFCEFRKHKNKIAVRFYDHPIEVNLEKDNKRLMTKIITNQTQLRYIMTKLKEKKMVV